MTGNLTNLKEYSGFTVPSELFFEAMERLRERYLNVALDAVIHPASETVQLATEKQQYKADRADFNDKDLLAHEWLEKAHKYWRDKNNDEAIYCATKAIELKFDFAEAYNRRGSAKNAKGDYDGAIKDFNESIQIKPDFAMPYSNRGLTFFYQYNFGNAIDDATTAIRLDPNMWQAYNVRGLAMGNMKNFDAAIQDFTAAIRLSPNNYSLYLYRSAIFGEMEDYSSEINDLEKSIQLGNPDPATKERLNYLCSLKK